MVKFSLVSSVLTKVVTVARADRMVSSLNKLGPWMCNFHYILKHVSFYV